MGITISVWQGFLWKINIVFFYNIKHLVLKHDKKSQITMWLMMTLISSWIKRYRIICMLLVGKELGNHDPDVWFSCNEGRQSHHLEFTGSVFVFCWLPQLELRRDASFIHFQILSQFKQLCVSVCVCARLSFIQEIIIAYLASFPNVTEVKIHDLYDPFSLVTGSYWVLILCQVLH